MAVFWGTLQGCRQLGADRVVDFRFGYDEYECHIILELYKGGNIILTDKNFTILTLLRSYQDAEGRKVAVKETYTPAVRTITQQQHDDTSSDSGVAVNLRNEDDTVAEQIMQWLDKEAQVPIENRKQKKQRMLKSVLCSKGTGLEHFGPVLIEHALLRAGLDPQDIVGEDQFSGINRETASALVRELRYLGDTLRWLQSDPSPGYIVVKSKDGNENDSLKGEVLNWKEYKERITEQPGSDNNNEKQNQKPKEFGEEYEFVEITPTLFEQHSGAAYITLPSFDKAAEQYFSRYEQYRREQRHHAALSAAQSRIERVKKDQQERIEMLQREQEHFTKQASLIEANMETVDTLIRVVGSSIQNGISWDALCQTIVAEQRQGNPLALLISGCDFELNQITIQLYDPDWNPQQKEKLKQPESRFTTPQKYSKKEEARRLEELSSLLPDTDSKDDVSQDDNSMVRVSRESQEGAIILPASAMVDVPIDLSNTAAGNASLLYRKSKGSRIKAEKTEMAGSHALQNAERRANEIVQQAESSLQKDEGRVARKRLWFEKFYWFITTEGLVVVAGRDAQQNEQLVRKYLRPQDAYIHADAHGSATCVLRNPSDSPNAVNHLPSLQPSLEQAGAFAVNMSSQWSSGIPTSAWWVYAHQVSKTAPTGEYLSTGSFMIRGQKNMLPPVKMEMGMTILFRVDDNCVANHLYDRSVRAELPEIGDKSETSVNQSAPNQTRTDDSAALRGNKADTLQDGSKDKTDNNDETTLGTEDVSVEVDEVHHNKDGNDDDHKPLGGQGVGTGGKISAKVRKVAKRIEETESIPQQEALQKALLQEEERRKCQQKDDNSLSATVDKSSSKAETADKCSKSNRTTKKQQKRRKKYEEQDDEERELAMIALGMKSLPEDTEAHETAAENTDKYENHEVAVTNPVHFSGIGEDYGSSNELKSIREVRQAQGEMSSRLDPSDMEASSKRIGKMLKSKSQQNEAGDSDSDEENIKTGSGGQTVLEVDGKSYSGEALALAALVGNPKEDDVLLHTIAMVAPYSALQGPYKYKVKLAPGNQKKGKGGRSALDSLLRSAQEIGTKRECDLIKSIPEPEITQIMVGNVRIVSGSQNKGKKGNDKSKGSNQKNNKVSKKKTK